MNEKLKESPEISGRMPRATKETVMNLIRARKRSKFNLLANEDLYASGFNEAVDEIAEVLERLLDWGEDV